MTAPFRPDPLSGLRQATQGLSDFGMMGSNLAKQFLFGLSDLPVDLGNLLTFTLLNHKQPINIFYRTIFITIVFNSNLPSKTLAVFRIWKGKEKN